MALRMVAALVGIAVVAAFLWLPVYNTGDALIRGASGITYVWLFAGVALVCLPVVLPQSWAHRVSVLVGTLMIIGSFVSVLGMFFIPAGVLLLASAWLERHSGRSPKSA